MRARPTREATSHDRDVDPPRPRREDHQTIAAAAASVGARKRMPAYLSPARRSSDDVPDIRRGRQRRAQAAERALEPDDVIVGRARSFHRSRHSSFFQSFFHPLFYPVVNPSLSRALQPAVQVHAPPDPGESPVRSAMSWPLMPPRSPHQQRLAIRSGRRRTASRTTIVSASIGSPPGSSGGELGVIARLPQMIGRSIARDRGNPSPNADGSRSSRMMEIRGDEDILQQVVDVTRRTRPSRIARDHAAVRRVDGANASRSPAATARTPRRDRPAGRSNRSAAGTRVEARAHVPSRSRRDDDAPVGRC